MLAPLSLLIFNPKAQAQPAHPPFYQHDEGFCRDLNASGQAYIPSRPLWSDLAGLHYDGIIQRDNSPSVRYPSYENISHNLAVLESLQFLLSLTKNVTAKIDSAQTYLEQADFVNDLGEHIPQVAGHCLCLQGGCDPQQALDQAEDIFNELIDTKNIKTQLTNFSHNKLGQLEHDAQSLLDDLNALLIPSGGTSALEQALEQALINVIDQAFGNMIEDVRDQCSPDLLPDLSGQVQQAVQAEYAQIKAQLTSDYQTLQEIIERQILDPNSDLKTLGRELWELIHTTFAKDSLSEVFKADFVGLKNTLTTMVPRFQAVIDELEADAQAVESVWNNLTALNTRLRTFSTQLVSDLLEALKQQSNQMSACVDALQAAASFPATFDPQTLIEDLERSVEAALRDVWSQAQARIQQAHDQFEERVMSVYPEGTLELWADYTQDARDLVESLAEGCYQRGFRSECVDFCFGDQEITADFVAQDHFLWLPVDFLQNPATGAASVALFALEQTGFLDRFRSWVASQMETELGEAFSTVIGGLNDFSRAIQAAIAALGNAFDYIDRFTEGYHLGAYSELRPDLHMCIGYYGHGAYAQLGKLGGNIGSLGARYTSHNLSSRHRVQFRSGGFAMSLFGSDFSLAPGVELNAQIDGWKLWDQSKPFGLVDSINLSRDSVARYDLFNVVPMDRYPFYSARDGVEESEIELGSFVVRDLFPSRESTRSPAQWPRPNVLEPWEQRSIATLSLGLNYEFAYPAEGSKVIELPDLPVIPGVLTVVPSLEYRFGVGWRHDTNHLRDKLLEKINEHLPESERLSELDFNRDMHAMQGPDLSADNMSYAFVEPKLAAEAFVGFKVSRLRIGAGAKLKLGVNIKPQGAGGLVDLSTALGDTLVNSNPPEEAECKPIWSFNTSYQCNNTSFEGSGGQYACEPSEVGSSCCMTLSVDFDQPRRYRLCMDSWTGIDEGLCDQIGGADEQVSELTERLNALPIPDKITRLITPLLEGASSATLESSWRADASCADPLCGPQDAPVVLNTSIIPLTSLSECEQRGQCTFYDEGNPEPRVEHDLSERDCVSFEPEQRWIKVATANDSTCAIDEQGMVSCWSSHTNDMSMIPDEPFLELAVSDLYACGLTQTQEVRCWRFSSTNDSGQTNPPFGSYTAISTAVDHACAIRLDNQHVDCWGGPFSTGWSEVPPVPFQLIRSGRDVSCGINAQGLVQCFGEQLFGDYVFGTLQAQDVAFSGALGVCAVSALPNSIGDVVCKNLPQRDYPSNELCAWSGSPYPFNVGTSLTQVTTGAAYLIPQGECTVCAFKGVSVDGAQVDCFSPSGTSSLDFTGQPDSMAGYSDEGQALCGILESGEVECQGYANVGTRPRSDRPQPIFTPYSCVGDVTPELLGWEGEGCHPLQHGFPSACGCVSDEQCADSERCEAGVCTRGGEVLSCGCEDQSECSSGRSCVDGACVVSCADDAACGSGRRCVEGACAPEHGLGFAEQVTWRHKNPQGPMHLISTYAMSELYATLTLGTSLFVEASFKLFGKQRKWRLLDYNKGFDLGSTWKAWYQPGLEALYTDECAEPELREPVTNRHPRSLTYGVREAIINAYGIDWEPECRNKGVCRYRSPLPTREEMPQDYERGNVGDVDAFLRYCHADYKLHPRNPKHSNGGDVIGAIKNSYEFGYQVSTRLYAERPMCVDGQLWDEWLASLDPKLGGDATQLSSYDCSYTDRRDGQVYTFPCDEVNLNMLAIWGCLDPLASATSVALSARFPDLVISHPAHGSIIDLNQMFESVSEDDPTYGVGEVSDYSLDRMIDRYRYARTLTLSRLGERWLKGLEICFDDRFEDPRESECLCTTDDQCEPEGMGRCVNNACEHPRDPSDPNSEYVRSYCNSVRLVVPAGPCCGDGVVQNTERYQEACDDGPEGSDLCSPTCELLAAQEQGACCLDGEACFEDLNAAECAAQQGQYSPNQMCSEVDCLPTGGTDGGTGGTDGGTGGTDGGTGGAEGGAEMPTLGACCTGTACLNYQTEARCDALGGVWSAEASCSDQEVQTLCLVRQNPRGACCLRDHCEDNISYYICLERGGTPNPHASCQELNQCVPPEITGSCCTGDRCVDLITEAQCQALGGAFSSESNCDGRQCMASMLTGSCCTGELCVDLITEVQCQELSGVFSSESNCDGRQCMAPVLGACCGEGFCLEEVTEARCDERHGQFSANKRCDEPGVCEPPVVGACCLGGVCFDASTQDRCEGREGEWYDGAVCDEVSCPPPPVGGTEAGTGAGTGAGTEADESLGACCLPSGLCVEDISEPACEERGGTAWEQGALCIDCACQPVAMGDANDGDNKGGGGGCQSQPDQAPPLWALLALLALLPKRTLRGLSSRRA